MQRPEPIKITSALMAFKLCVGTGIVLTLSPWNAGDIHPKGHLTAAGMILALRLTYAIFVAVAALTIWSYWLGKFWARRVVLFACFLYLYNLIHIGNAWRHSRLQGIMTIYAAILALYLVRYLFTREAKNWFPLPPAAGREERYRSFVIDR